ILEASERPTKRIPADRGRPRGVRRLGGSPIKSGDRDEADGSRDSKLLPRPLQGAFLIPPVLPVVLIGTVTVPTTGTGGTEHVYITSSPLSDVMPIARSGPRRACSFRPCLARFPRGSMAPRA